MEQQPFHCEARQGRDDSTLNGYACVCMCDTGAQTASPTPAPMGCYHQQTSYDSEHMLGGVLETLGSAAMCQAECVSAPRCRYWSYAVPTQQCYLYTGAARPVVGSRESVGDRGAGEPLGALL